MTENFRFSKTRQNETFYVIFKHNDYLLDFQDILQCVAKSTWHNFDESWVVGANSKSNMYSISHYWKCNYRVQTMYYLPSPGLSYLVVRERQLWFFSWKPKYLCTWYCYTSSCLLGSKLLHVYWRFLLNMTSSMQNIFFKNPSA